MGRPQSRPRRRHLPNTHLARSHPGRSPSRRRHPQPVRRNTPRSIRTSRSRLTPKSSRIPAAQKNSTAPQRGEILCIWLVSTGATPRTAYPFRCIAAEFLRRHLLPKRKRAMVLAVHSTHHRTSQWKLRGGYLVFRPAVGKTSAHVARRIIRDVDETVNHNNRCRFVGI